MQFDRLQAGPAASRNHKAQPRDICTKSRAESSADAPLFSPIAERIGRSLEAVQEIQVSFSPSAGPESLRLKSDIQPLSCFDPD